MAKKTLPGGIPTSATPPEGDEVYRYAAELADLIVWTADAHGQFVSISPRFTELTGLPPGTQRAAMHPDDADEAMRGWEQATAAGIPHTTEFRMLMKDGSYRYFRARSGPRRDEPGQLVGWYGFTDGPPICGTSRPLAASA